MPRRPIKTAWKLLVERYLPFVRETTGIPGIAVAVVSLDDAFEQTASIGVRSLKERHRVDQHTAFPLASLSKPIASSIVALLQAERHRLKSKQLEWTDDVPRLSIARPLTYANLFSHRSGLPRHAGDLLEDLGLDRDTILSRLGKLELNPLDRYAYTNFGLTAAAVRAAESVDEVWEDLADRLLYQKLGMRSTCSRFETFCERENRTWGHRRGDDGHFFVGPQRNPDQQSPAGGVTSSAHDLIAWMKLQLGDPDTLLAANLDDFAWIEKTHHPYLDDGAYGYGWNVQTDDAGRAAQLSHSGAFGMGAATSVVLWPQERLGIVALTNAEPLGAAEALCGAFKRLLDDEQLTVEQLATVATPSRDHPDRNLTFLTNVMDATYGLLRPPRRDAHHLAPGDTFSFKGTYASAFYGEVHFEYEDMSLIMYLGESTETFDNRYVLRRTHARNVFEYDSRGECAAANCRVEFLRGDETRPSRVRLWNLFVSYPQSLAAQGEAVCPLDGVVRVWSLVSTAPAKVALTVTRNGDRTMSVYPAVNVVIGTNRFADANIEVRAGDRIGFQSNAQPGVSWQHPGANVKSLDFEIDREGTFVRVN